MRFLEGLSTRVIITEKFLEYDRVQQNAVLDLEYSPQRGVTNKFTGSGDSTWSVQGAKGHGVFLETLACPTQTEAEGSAEEGIRYRV